MYREGITPNSVMHTPQSLRCKVVFCYVCMSEYQLNTV